MKQLYAGLAGIFFALAIPVQAEEADRAASFENNMGVTSYALGVQTGRTLKRDGVDIDVEQFIKGLKDQTGKQKLQLTEDQLRKILNTYQSDIRRNMKRNRAIATAENLRKGKAFLDENKTKEGVQALASGVQYKILKAGSGAKPTEKDTVVCHYRGTTIAGVQFDASEEGAPATMKVAQLIPGFREALMQMPVGSRWQIVIPSALAYGPRSVGDVIGPNETLIFEVELVSIK